MAHDERSKKILSHFEDLQSKRYTWENHWWEVSEHALGRRQFIFKHSRIPGEQRMTRIYDTTSRDSANLLAAALHALLTNPDTSWFDLRFVMDELNDVDEAALWLEEVKKRMQTSFRRPDSGFTTQMHEFYIDLVAFGTAAMFMADEPGFGPRFSSRPLDEVFIDEDVSGRIAVVFRKFDMPAWRAVDQFGEENVPRAAKVVEKNPNQTFEFLHMIRRRGKPLPGRIDSLGMPWESIYLGLGEQNDQRVVAEGGFWENPYLVSRWSVDSGEIYGRGPGIDSLPDQKMLNAIWRTFIRQIEKAVDPPILVDDDSVMPGSQLRVTPSAQITVRNEGGNREPIRYLESRAQLQLAPELIDGRSRKIEKAYHSEIIQAFQDPRMTATQVIELARLSQRILSPVLGRARTEVLDPMLERNFGILMRSGRLPDPPDFLEGQDIQIEYVSPVARAQKASEAQAILDGFAAAAAMAQADPSVMDNVNLDEAVRLIFEGNGVPVKVLRPRADVIEIRRVQAQITQQDEQQQALLQTGEVAAKLIPAVANAGRGSA